MILTAHQPVYLPWLGLFHKIALADSFCYFDDVQYQVKDFNGRNKIKTINDSIWLTVPVKAKGYRDKKIKEIEIDNSQDWRNKHFKSIYLNYKKAPFFNNYADFFEDVYKKDWTYLSDLNEYMLKWFLRELGVKVNYYKASEMDFQGYKSDLVLDMCKKLKADLYIFGALGKDYADEQKFNKENVKIYFQDYKHPVYHQLNGNFLPYISIMDLLFNCGDKSLEVLMSGNITKEELIKKFNLYGNK
jgi:hypothetical protein